MEKLVATPAEAAKALSMRPNDIYDLLEKGEIKAFRPKGNWKIPWTKLQEYIDERSEKESRERREHGK